MWLSMWLAGFLASGNLAAQAPLAPGNTQRYFSLLQLNLSQEKDFELEVIRQAADAGVNSLLLTVHWDKVYRKSPSEPGDWYRYDSQVQLATKLGLKVAIRVMIGRNRNDLKGFWTEAESMKDYKQYPLREAYDATSFSYLHQPSVELAADFVRQVTERYKYLQKDNNLIFFSVVTTPTQEAGYHMINIPPKGEYLDNYLSIFDYSDFYKKGFRTWLQEKYKKIIRLNLLWGAEYKTFEEVLPPVTPWEPKESFFGRRGKDWYIFRHLALKQFNDRMIKTIKDVDKNIGYINEFGAVSDAVSGVRGTLAFRDLGEKTDGVKIHDDARYDHRWTMDIIRGSIRPDQWVMNEVFYADYLPSSEFYEQIDECFESGAKMVAFVLSTTGHIAAMRDVIRNSANKWIPKPMTPIVTSDTVAYRLSRAVDKSVDDLAYGAWKQKARGNGPPRPVSVVLIEDLLQPEYWKAAENVPPYLLSPVPMQIIAVSSDFTYKLPTDTFADRDGTVVRMEVSGLPTWLRYENGQLIGKPTALGDTRLLVRGVDDEGGATEAYFTIRVDTRENANKPPTVKKSLTTVTASLNKPFEFTLPKDLFADADGTVTRIEVGTLPSWLAFQDGQFKGFPTKVEEYRIALKAYDDLNAFVETFFTIQVVEPQFLNNPPYVQKTLPVKFTKVNEPFRYTLPADIFGDSDGYISLITVQTLPAWLNFSLNEFSGTPTEQGEYRVLVRAYDNNGGYVETPLLIRVEIPQITFDLMRSGTLIERQRILTLKEGDELRAGSLPPRLNVNAYGNFEFDRIDFDLSGPYRHSSRAFRFPHALFPEDGGFAPYVGGYTLTASAYRKDSLVLVDNIQFSIAPGDSSQVSRSLEEWAGYPNPFESVFNIQLPDGQPVATYSFSLVSANGQRQPIPAKWITLYGSIAQINLSGLSIAPGIHFVRVESEGKELRLFKVLKK
ncbi:putative Ig domain-containing protein [Persicitalea sp.]|uniref:putative Ig domain-containing protein n=1 Tax=Persicitalea sp. TaxID=3100273 RepID=UPI003593F65A